MAYRKGICCFYVQVVGKMSDGRNASSSGTAAWDVFLPTRKREAFCGALFSLTHIDVLLAQHLGCFVMLGLVCSLFL